MDTVKSFNQELSSLYEVKPPISKAKMTALTRGAIKAIKFYKHVVQSVEKFILKCKSEYKVPGLYVIDSIVRQSRHQFGADRDVFAPRFAKNMQQTFVNLFKCPPEDKSKIIRVLNLWQKNNVFLPEVIQPLFDLADPNNPIYKEIDAMQQSANGFNNTSTTIAKGSPALQRTPTKGQQGNETLHGTSTNLNLTDPSVLQQLQQLQRLISKNVENSTRTEPVHFDKKLLDFDYDEDDDDIHPSPRPQQPTAESILPVTSLLTNPEVLRQLQTLQQTMANAAQPQTQDIDTDRLRKMQEMKQQEEEFDKHLAQTVPNLPFAAECEFRSTSNHLPTQGNYYVDGMNPPPPQYHTDFDQQANQIMLEKSHQLQQDNNAEVEVITLDQDDSHSESPGEDRYRKRKRSRSRSRDRRGRDRDRRRSRSRSGSRRRRSRSRERSKKDKDKEKSREERERETERDRERKKRGLPVIKKDHLSVCSTTLWVGHLSKLVHQDDLSNTFGEFGDVVSIDLIPPRGCAFIVMLRRQDAAKCLTRLKGHNLHGKNITLAWAPGKGVKGKDLKDYWEGDLGVSYIPYTKIKHDIDIDLLEDGGMVDEETMPQWMKDKVEKMGKKPSLDIPNFSINTGTTTTTIDTSQPPPIPGAGLLQPPPMLPMFQFNNRLLGMNVPPGMMPNLSNMPSLSNMPNIPIGVPPPNMAGPPLMGLGLGSHFQGFKVGPPNMMPPQLPSLNNKPGNVNADDSLHSIGESLMNITQSFGMVPQPPAPHEDTMDIEMEDAESKPSDNKNSSYNEQPSSQFNRSNRDDDRRDRRDDRRNRSRDGRDNRERDRSRDRHSRERDRDRRYRNDRDNSRGRDRRDDRRDNRDRDRGNRWENRDRRDNRDSERDDRREKEKTLNDRLREMAGMGGGYDDRNRGDRFNRDREPPFKFAPFRNNGRSEEEFGRDRQRDRVDSNERDRSNESKTKLEEENEKKDGEDQTNDKTEDKLDGTIDIKEDEASEKNVEEEKEEEKQNDSTGDSQEAKTSENAEGSQKDRKESLNFEAPFDAPPLFDGPPPFDGPPGVFDLPPRSLFGAPPLFNEAPPMFNDGPPPLGMFNDGPPRGFFNDGMMFDEGMPMRGRGRGRGRRGGRDNMRMDGPPDLNMLDGPPMGFPDGPLMMDDRFLRGGRRGGMRGMPRDEFFPRDDFSPRGRGRGRGRGMIFRGRGGRGGFNPRFDGPPYEGLPPFEKPFDELPGPPQFDGPPGPFRGGPRFDGRFRGNQRREDRLWVKPEFNSSPRGGGRRSRWGSSPPPGDDGEGDGGFVEEPFMDEGGESMEERLDVPIESEGGEPDGNGFVEGGDGGEFDDGSGFEPEEAPQDGKCTPVVDERPPPQESGDAEEASDGPPGE